MMKYRGKEWNEGLEKLQDRLEYHFNNLEYLERAMIHRSYLNESNDKTLESNERLEFLGDAVLELVVSDVLFRKFPKLPEGVLTKKRSQAVCEPSFYYLAETIKLGDILILGRGEESSGGRNKPSILSDAFEALCGAIYLDGGYNFIYDFFNQNIDNVLEKEKDEERIFIDYKTRMQEYCHKKGLKFSYKLLKEEGPCHDKHYTMMLEIDGRRISTGEGKSKKQAEQMAAKNAYEELGEAGE